METSNTTTTAVRPVPTTSVRYLGRHKLPYSQAADRFLVPSRHPSFKPRHRADLDGIA